MILEPAKPDDLDDIIAMRTEANEWLRQRGIDQWSRPWPSQDEMLATIEQSIHAGETWMVRDDGTNTATVALDTLANPCLWTAKERQQPALYLHRLIVRRGWEGLGSKILDWASDRAATLGKDWLRIDVWTHNTPLHQYYLRHDFQHVRTLDLDDYPSGALFQRRTHSDGASLLPAKIDARQRRM